MIKWFGLVYNGELLFFKGVDSEREKGYVGKVLGSRMEMGLKVGCEVGVFNCFFFV